MVNRKDEEILDFLMTSDFNEDLSPEQLKFLLLKFRQFYRISSNKYNNIEMERKKFDYDLELIKREHSEKMNILEIDYQNLLNKYNLILNRKLKLKERLIGKVLPNDNESL